MHKKDFMMEVILTADEVMWKGLGLAGFDGCQNSICHEQNIQRFKAYFGSKPIICAQIWEDPQTTNIPDAWVSVDMACINSYLLALHFLKTYPTKTQQAGVFKICKKTVQKWAWFYATKIRALKAEKVSLQQFGRICSLCQDIDISMCISL